MPRLDDETLKKLGFLTRVFDRPAAKVLRHLIAQATLENFRQGWRRHIVR